MDLRL
jgi:NAD(P)H-dependent FMN reductase